MLDEKVALIYEYNKNSALFTRAADLEIKKNNLETALEILIDGIKKFPAYPTAYLLLGKVLELQGEYEQAEKAFVKGADLLKCKSTLNFYINEMENQRSVDSHFSVSRRVSFLNDDIKNLFTEKEIASSVITPVNKSLNDFEELEKDIENIRLDDRLDDLARKINSAKIIIDDKHPFPERNDEKKSGGQEIISETIAKIYSSQGKFKEAINVFEKLKLKFPYRKQEFQIQIDEIKNQVPDIN
ncbi:MAG: tetratricopeptide repeat protein [Ignavibacteriales bacterium]|nr:tetratricopeptide repeat protein [Ignavibacteriales bacterium]